MGFDTSFNPAGAEGSQRCTAPLWVRPFLQLFPGATPSASGKVPAGSESDCEGLEGWEVVSGCTLFSPVSQTGPLPAGRLVALLISCSSSQCFSSLEKTLPLFPELKHQLRFFLWQLDWTHNFSLQTQGSVLPPLLFPACLLPFVKSFSSQVFQCVQSCSSASHTPKSSLATSCTWTEDLSCGCVPQNRLK